MAETALHAVADVASAAALFADPTRARIVAALSDGRALPASMLAAEAGVAASTASEHLTRLVAGGLLRVHQSGRHRYYSIAGEHVAGALEALSLVAPPQPVRSLRESTRAASLRRARTCYDHLAGRLGVAVTAALVEHGALERTDGRQGVERGPADQFAAPVAVAPYRLGAHAPDVFGALGVAVSDVAGSGRPLLRFCVDWTEQRHHLAGALGARLAARMESAQWIRRLPSHRAVALTDDGRAALARVLGEAAVADY